MIIHLYGDLPTLLPKSLRGQTRIEACLQRRTSVKDLIEAYDVPHTEIGRLSVDGQEVDFGHIVDQGDNGARIEVMPVLAPLDPRLPSRLRPQPLPMIAFAVDQNVGRLAPLLRMVGFDASYQHGISDPELADFAARSQRILLSKDRDLLKRKKIEHGRLIREILPERQLAEVLAVYGLKDQVQPFTRCLRCNGGILQEVAKEEIVDRLEPLTIKYYDEFFICNRCGQIFWPGTHLAKMARQLTRLGLPSPE